MNKNVQIKLAVDWEMILVLAKFDNPQIYDPTGEIMQGLATHTLMPSKYKHNENRPLILHDAFLNCVNYEKSDRYYDNLNFVYTIYNAVLDGTVELYATPLVAFNAMNDVLLKDFLFKHVNILSVKDEDYPEFSKRRKELTNAYIKSGAIDMNIKKKNGKKTNFVAMKMAEATLFNLFFLVKRDDLYIHKNVEDNDYARKNLIEKINKSYGYTSITNKGMNPVVPINVRSLFIAINQCNLGNILKYPTTTLSVNANDNYEYQLK